MTLNKLITAAAFVCAAFAVSASSVQAQNVNQRLKNQNKRITSGVAHHNLTHRGAVKLRAADHRIHRSEKIDRMHNGGNLTNNEKHRLQHRLNHNSKKIYKAKHS